MSDEMDTLDCPKCGRHAFEYRHWSGDSYGGYDETGHHCTACGYEEI